MASHQSFADLGIPAEVSVKLSDLAIRGVGQLYARLKHEAPGLQRYLQLSDAAFADLFGRVERAVSDADPAARLPQVHPEVNKTGVAVRRPWPGRAADE